MPLGPHALVEDVAGRRLLFVMAADPEYGRHLRARFVPLMTGVGPVEAAAVLGDALARLDAAGTLPDLVVSLGSAGSATLAQGSIHQVRSVRYRDMDATPLGVPAGVTPFLGLPAELELPWEVEGIPAASISTGADIVTGPAWADIDTDMVDMESWAVVRTCQRLDVPVIGLRGVSDGAEELRRIEDWSDFLHVVDEGLADAVDLVCAAVADGLLDA